MLLLKLTFVYYQKLKLMTYFQIHSFSQKAIESFEKIETKIEGGFILYINKNIRGKLIKHILL